MILLKVALHLDSNSVYMNMGLLPLIFYWLLMADTPACLMVAGTYIPLDYVILMKCWACPQKVLEANQHVLDPAR